MDEHQDTETPVPDSNPDTPPAPPPEPAPAPAASSSTPGPAENAARAAKTFVTSAERAIGQAYKATRTKLQSGAFEPCTVIRAVESVLDWARRTFPADMMQSLAGGLVRCGHTALLVAQVLTIVFGFVAAVRLHNWVLFAYGIGGALALLILQFTAGKFLNAGDALIKSSPSRLSCGAFPDCLALLAEVGGLLFLLSTLMNARLSGQWSLVWVGIGGLALFDAVAFIALHPSLTNTSMAENVGAGEEAIGLLSFLVKIVVRIVPIAFGVGTAIGTVGLLFGTISVARTGLIAAGKASWGLVAFCACLPFASYVFFAFYHLALDILRAILELPRKLDRLGPDGGAE